MKGPDPIGLAKKPGVGFVGRQDRQQRDVDQGRAERHFGFESDGLVIGGLNRVEIGPQRSKGPLQPDEALEGALDIPGGQRIAVVEAHPRAQGKDPGGWVRRVPLRGQARLKLAGLRVAGDQCIEHVAGDREHRLLGCLSTERVKPDDAGRQRNLQLAGRGAGAGRRGARSARGSRRRRRGGAGDQ